MPLVTRYSATSLVVSLSFTKTIMRKPGCAPILQIASAQARFLLLWYGDLETSIMPSWTLRGTACRFGVIILRIFGNLSTKKLSRLFGMVAEHMISCFNDGLARLMIS